MSNNAPAAYAASALIQSLEFGTNDDMGYAMHDLCNLVQHLGGNPHVIYQMQTQRLNAYLLALIAREAAK